MRRSGREGCQCGHASALGPELSQSRGRVEGGNMTLGAFGSSLRIALTEIVTTFHCAEKKRIAFVYTHCCIAITGKQLVITYITLWGGTEPRPKVGAAPGRK